MELECNINSNAIGIVIEELGFIFYLVKYNIVDY
jgi:hypothetical protein